MISGFLNSWPMFSQSYLAALFAGLLLSFLGVIIVARAQVFLAAAVAQASLLGLALDALLNTGQPAAFSVAFSVFAALATGARAQRGGTSHEEITAWIFLVGASCSILLLAKHPNGLKFVQATMASSIIGAAAVDVVTFAALAAVAGLFVVALRQRIVLFVCDPVMAAAVGMRIGAWSLGLATALGLSTGLVIRSSGLLFTFGCLVLPALVAKNLCREAGTMFFVAPVVCAASVLTGLALANHYDFPPGQIIVALLAALLVGAWVWREFRTWFGG
jgi:ABC-type Mn2+/Zn2+ transport system permease subunit